MKLDRTRPLIPYVRAFEPCYGKAVAISTRVRRVTANNPGPFTFKGTNSYIVGSKKVIIIDPGPDHDDHLETLVHAVRGETVAAILLTHTHNDHWPLTPRLARAVHAPVYACSRPTDGLVPDHQILDGDVWSFGSATLRAVATPGHVNNHFGFEIVEENALICGDHVMAWSTTAITEGGSLYDYISSLKHMIARRYDRLIPAHGTHLDTPDGFLQALLAHRQYREDEIKALFTDTSRLSVDSVQAHLYAGLPETQHRAARMSVVAHLRKLEADGFLIANAQDGYQLARMAGSGLAPTYPPST